MYLAESCRIDAGRGRFWVVGLGSGVGSGEIWRENHGGLLMFDSFGGADWWQR
jgi:hypothetical protein